jgi:hypothetical protein
MRQELDYVTQRLLNTFCEEAPNMKIAKVMNFCKEFQELRDAREIHEFIIMMLLAALGFDDNGNLRNENVGERLKTADDSVWIAINQAIKIHGGYACSPFTADNWAEKVVEKFRLNADGRDKLSNEVQNMKDSQLRICFSEIKYE